MKTSYLFAISMLVLLSGCSNYLKKLDKEANTATGFSYYLAKSYHELAKAEAARYDWRSSSRFAKKGLEAARGYNVEPEVLGRWVLRDNTEIAELLDARTTLIGMLASKIKQEQYEKLAIAQVSFDCWVEEASEGDANGIKTCKEHFYHTLDSAVFKKGGETSIHITKDGYALYFRHGAVLNHIDHYNLKIIAKYIMKEVRLRNAILEKITIDGYTDATGKHASNKRLSKVRAHTIAKYLIKAGIPKRKVLVQGHGEDRETLAIDNHKEGINRRVEIKVVLAKKKMCLK